MKPPSTSTLVPAPRPLVGRVPEAAPALPLLGHNRGPALEEQRAPIGDWNYYCWRRALRAAWKTPPREIALRRLRRAEQLGMTYREYTAIILDTGRFL